MMSPMAPQQAPVDTAEHWRPRPPLTRAGVARLVQAAGLFSIFSWLLPPRHGRLEMLSEFVPTAGILTARAATVASGALLIYLGGGLRRGKRRAWQLAVGLSAAGVALHVAKGLDFGAAVVSGVMLAMLITVQ